MKILKGILISLFISCVSCSKPNNKIQTTTVIVETPFSMPPIEIPDFNHSKQFDITTFGAVKGNKEINTKAISEAISKANEIGGGVVVIPKGEWLTKTIHLKSNVNLHLNKDAVLLFSEAPEDYLPAVHTTWEGMECYNYSPLIYAYKCKNIAITGEGKLKAKMDVWKTWFPRPEPHMNSLKQLYNLASYNKPVEERQMVNDTAHFRPQFIQFNRSENILLEGVSIENSPFWTIHPYLSKDVVIRNLNVYAHGHNNDGVDPEMSENVLIENCVFDQGDDAIAIKSGRNQDAWRLNTPSKNIVMRNCTMKNGHQLVAIGSELSGGIENVFVDNCNVNDGAKMFHLVFIKTNERRGGYVKNVFVENIKAGKISKGVLGIETDVLYQWRDLVPTIERKLTPISDVHLKNVSATETEYLSKIFGQAELPIENIFLNNVSVENILKEKHIHENVINFMEN
ncbi:glycoside hydrolase family 28 protein [Aestuariibaculum lutulentum]|uniref:Glycoside hydrolase family 28 protein n=1 Tax=Aestuariibaculum lutulentum TaxID=2920935 RepID=A0ABS9RFL4_9FLAO|nr:glycoside hydrolase family 28 protein [Aestuariibaculum lutulentum]MCH4551736.1 glycoside hydrolase family 28 protein [Aestuariibaculum lutulentum]